MASTLERRGGGGSAAGHRSHVISETGRLRRDRLDGRSLPHAKANAPGRLAAGVSHARAHARLARFQPFCGAIAPAKASLPSCGDDAPLRLPETRQSPIMRDMTERDDTRHDMPSDTPEGDRSGDATRQPEPDVLLQVEAAEVAGVSVRTIQRAIDRGALPAQRIDGKCWIRRDDLLAWNAARQAPGRHDARHASGRHDASPHATTNTTRHASDRTGEADDARVARLERALMDALAERDRWHEAWHQAEERRIQEADALRDLLLLAQQTALARVQAIEAGSVEPHADAVVAANKGSGAATPDATTGDAAQPNASLWGRFWRALTGR